MMFMWLYVLTFVIFLAIDFLGLNYLIRPIFEREIGHMLSDELRLLPALVFYAFFIFGVLWFVSLPAFAGDRSLLWVFGNAALLGAIAYGTYEFTNFATLKDWSRTMVVVDLSWGTLLTGVSAASGVALVRVTGG